MTCTICQRAVDDPRATGALILCEACARSYDRQRREDVTIAALIVWVANRTRRFCRPPRRPSRD